MSSPSCRTCLAGFSLGLVFKVWVVVLCLGLPLAGLGQGLELNVQAKAGTRSAEWLGSRARAENASLLRDTRQAPHLRGCNGVEALARPRDERAGRAVAQCYTLSFEGTDTVGQINQLMGSGEFEWVEVNRRIALHLPPVDSSRDARVGEQWYHQFIQTFAAWDTTRGSSSVVVGILDTGLDYGHPEFEGQIAVNAAEDINGSGRFEPWADTVSVGGLTGDLDGVDQDGNGYADDVIGYDFTDQPRSPFGGDYLGADPDPMDDNDHGTLVAGIVAAKADNDLGGTGIAPGCRLKVLRAFSAGGSGEDDDIARAIVYAADNGILILNFSFGDIYPSQMMHAAIRYAYAKGVVMVGSSGNGTGDNLHYPSGFDEVISVGASSLSFDETTEILWPLSSFGHSLTLVAPGSNILCPIVRDTANDSDFDFFSGTSTAAPMVSAAVALLFSQRGQLSPQQVRGILAGSADDLNAVGWDHYTGAGRLNLLKALRTVAASNVQILNPANDGGASGDSLWVVATALDPEFQSYELSYQRGTEGLGSWIPVAGGSGTGQVLADTIALWRVGNLSQGEYTLRLSVLRGNGLTLEHRVRVVLDRSAPEIVVRHAVEAWDNEVRKLLFVYRSSDRGQTRLKIRALGQSQWSVLNQDRITRNGAFLVGPEVLGAGGHEYLIESRNEAGLWGSTALDTVAFASGYVSQAGYVPTGLSLPMGHYLQAVQDFDQDGLKEVVMSEYDSGLGFGRLKVYEYNAVGFTAVDSLGFKPILIPKDVADADGDGLLELLSSVNDSLYITEQSGSGVVPKGIRYQNLGRGLFASRFGDTDGDGTLELICKDLKDHKVLEPSGNDYQMSATLADVSPDYVGSVAPRTLVGDFDGDGRPEVVYGDFDGDVLLYEHDGGNGYGLRWIDSTGLSQSGGYLLQGDFDGDGREDVFVAVHSPLNRNEEDFEYEAPYWWLRIFEASADNTYGMVWEDFLYDIDTDDFNAATVAQLDGDAGEEIIFTTFPRTYVIEWDGVRHGMEWFHYGALCTHHVAADFDGDGTAEFALGRGDTAFFWQKDVAATGTKAVAFLGGEVLDSTRTALQWSASVNGTGYRIWRGEYNGPGTIQIALIDSVVGQTYEDVGLDSGQVYLYVVEAKNPGLVPVYSPFSYAILLKPHGPGRLLSVEAVEADLLRLRFDVPVRGNEGDAVFFRVDSTELPVAVVGGADGSRELLLALGEPLEAGVHVLEVDRGYRDAELGRLDSATLRQAFAYVENDSAYCHFLNWRIVDPQRAEIRFSTGMEDGVRTVEDWSVAPYGRVVGVEWQDAGQTVVWVQVEGVALGALGYPVSLTLHAGRGLDGSLMNPKEGNTATFTKHKEDLSGVYVYPNPYYQHELYAGVRFANLTRTARVHVYSAAGRKVISLDETDGDGGLEWNLVDAWGARVKPGTYLYKVEAEGVEAVVGKFSVLE